MSLLSAPPRSVSRRVATLALPLALLFACEPSKPARIETDPDDVMKFYKKGQESSIQLSAFKESGKPFTAPLKPTFKSSDETVATVDKKGVVTSTGSGTAKIEVSAQGADATVDVLVMIVGGIEFAPDMGKEFKANQEERIPIKVIVKDDKGRPMQQHPKIKYMDTSGCIDVYQDGTFAPYQKGECSIVATVGSFEARHRVKVK